MTARVIRLGIATVSVAAWGCGGLTMPSAAAGSIMFTQLSPPSPSMIVVSDGTPPGAFIRRDSGQVSVSMVIWPDRDVAWAQLNVYLLTSDGYCGQNLPDAPSWGPVERGRPIFYGVRGFQVFRLPCDVTGIRAMLHLRNNGLLIPPMPSETLAEETVAVNYSLRQ